MPLSGRAHVRVLFRIDGGRASARGVAAYAAAAISGADPVKTGVQGFRYEIRTGLLPFIFIFNSELLLIDIGGAGHFVMVVGCAIVAMGCFVAATQNWLLTRNRWYETIALLLICFTLFRPGYWLDKLQAPFDRSWPATDICSVADDGAAGRDLALPRAKPIAYRRRGGEGRAADDDARARPEPNACKPTVYRSQRRRQSHRCRLVRFGSEADEIRPVGGRRNHRRAGSGAPTEPLLVCHSRTAAAWRHCPSTAPTATIYGRHRSIVGQRRLSSA